MGDVSSLMQLPGNVLPMEADAGPTACDPGTCAEGPDGIPGSTMAGVITWRVNLQTDFCLSPLRHYAFQKIK